VLNRTEQARKVTRALNSLFSSNISVNTKIHIFSTVITSILTYSWEIRTLGYKFKEKLVSTELDFWRRTARMSEIVKSEKLSHQRKNGSNTNSFGKMKNSML
jgi:RNA binding exosome subunit